MSSAVHASVRTEDPDVELDDEEQDSMMVNGDYRKRFCSRSLTRRDLACALGVQLLLLLLLAALGGQRFLAGDAASGAAHSLGAVQHSAAGSAVSGSAATCSPCPTCLPSPSSSSAVVPAAGAASAASMVVVTDPQGMYVWKDEASAPSGHEQISAAQLACLTQTPLPTIRQLGEKHNTDKVIGAHHYDQLYDFWLAPYRCKKIKMLEIGLGCDMHYGPGHSYHMWLEYFPFVELHYLEYDAACVSANADKLKGATMHTGDQADPEVLKKILRTGVESFDIIIDDGGHTWKQQHAAFEWLFLYGVKPGGLFIMEDLLTSSPGFGGAYKDAARDPITKYAGFAKLLMDDDVRSVAEWSDPFFADPRLGYVRQMSAGAGMVVFHKYTLAELADDKRTGGHYHPRAKPVNPADAKL